MSCQRLSIFLLVIITTRTILKSISPDTKLPVEYRRDSVMLNLYFNDYFGINSFKQLFSVEPIMSYTMDYSSIYNDESEEYVKRIRIKKPSVYFFENSEVSLILKSGLKSMENGETKESLEVKYYPDTLTDLSEVNREFFIQSNNIEYKHPVDSSVSIRFRDGIEFEDVKNSLSIEPEHPLV